MSINIPPKKALKPPKGSEHAPAADGGTQKNRHKAGKFQKGNTAAAGSPKPGRTPGSMQRVLRQFLEDPFGLDPAGRSLHDIAWEGLYEALTEREEIRNAQGKVVQRLMTRNNMRAIELVLAYDHGRPKEMKQVNVSALHLIQEVRAAVDTRRAAELTRKLVVNTAKETVNGKSNGHAGPVNGHSG